MQKQVGMLHPGQADVVVEDLRLKQRRQCSNRRTLADLGDVSGLLPLPVLPATGPGATRLDVLTG